MLALHAQQESTQGNTNWFTLAYIESALDARLDVGGATEYMTEGVTEVGCECIRKPLSVDGIG